MIATPVHTHYRLAKAALEAGKHVLVEKPITSNADQARELVDLAKKNGLTLMVGHTFVYNPAVEAVREIVQSGQLGDIFYINATRANLGLVTTRYQRDVGPGAARYFDVTVYPWDRNLSVIKRKWRSIYQYQEQIARDRLSDHVL